MVSIACVREVSGDAVGCRTRRLDEYRRLLLSEPPVPRHGPDAPAFIDCGKGQPERVSTPKDALQALSAYHSGADKQARSCQRA